MADAEQMLTDRWSAAKEAALDEVTRCDYNLGRIATIYSGQLSLSVLEDDYPRTVYQEYDPLQDRRSIAIDGEW